MKVCTGCKETKPLVDFQKRKSNKDGHHTKCKTCLRKVQRDHYHASPTRRHEIYSRNQQAILNNKRFVLDYLRDNPCVVCGEDDPIVLEFDHRDPEHKTLEIAKMVVQASSRLRIQTEIAKCDVLCANCHRRKTSKERGHFRTMMQQTS